MSWSYSKTGRASKMTEVVKQQFADTGGTPKGTAEEAAKNLIGVVAEVLCQSLPDEAVVRIEASGSAWNEGSKARSQTCSFKLETLGGFVE